MTDRDATCSWNCTLPEGHSGTCSAMRTTPAPPMTPSALTTADLLAMLQVGSCVDTRDGMSLTSATEPLRRELLELRELRAWKDAVRTAIHSGCSGYEALDRANTERFEGTGPDA